MVHARAGMGAGRGASLRYLQQSRDGRTIMVPVLGDLPSRISGHCGLTREAFLESRRIDPAYDLPDTRRSLQTCNSAILADTRTVATFLVQEVRISCQAPGAAEVTSLLIARNVDPLAGYERYASANWDGCGSEPIARATLASARRFVHLLPDTLGAPDMAPGADGTIGLEWSFTDGALRKLFIDIGPGNVWSGYWRRASGERATLPPRQIDKNTASLLTELFGELGN